MSPSIVRPATVIVLPGDAHPNFGRDCRVTLPTETDQVRLGAIALGVQGTVRAPRKRH